MSINRDNKPIQLYPLCSSGIDVSMSQRVRLTLDCPRLFMGTSPLSREAIEAALIAHRAACRAELEALGFSGFKVKSHVINKEPTIITLIDRELAYINVFFNLKAYLDYGEFEV